ncbi:survival motor neuron interacting protein 1-domain-containing protein [Entophlyctis helioformis]|nr:survival motor neuron interacting protein 1-domain-containing protein [Entophlyctis helioformis]
MPPLALQPQTRPAAGSEAHVHPALADAHDHQIAACDGIPDLFRPSATWTESLIRSVSDLRAIVAKIRRLPQRSAWDVRPLPHAEDAASWHAFYASTAPTLPIIASLSHAQTLALLSMHTRWLAADNARSPSHGVSQRQAQWILASLVRLDTLLVSDETALLRDLCKACLRIRRTLVQPPAALAEPVDPGDSRLAAISMTLAIARHFYGQHDMT